MTILAEKKSFAEIVQPKEIDGLDLSVRTRNAFAAQDKTTIKDIVEMPADRVSIMRNAGEVTFKEMARTLLRRFHTPQWLITIASEFHYPEAERIDENQEATLKIEGWNCVTSGYRPFEYWMLERAIASLERGGIQYRFYRCGSSGIKIFRRGGVFVPEESED